jgi:hypothetical protein
VDVYFVVLHRQSVIQETHNKRMSLAKSRLDSRPDGHTTKDQTKKEVVNMNGIADKAG